MIPSIFHFNTEVKRHAQGIEDPGIVIGILGFNNEHATSHASGKKNLPYNFVSKFETRARKCDELIPLIGTTGKIIGQLLFIP